MQEALQSNDKEAYVVAETLNSLYVIEKKNRDNVIWTENWNSILSGSSESAYRNTQRWAQTIVIWNETAKDSH